jgi:hypothetical protein
MIAYMKYLIYFLVTIFILSFSIHAFCEDENSPSMNIRIDFGFSMPNISITNTKNDSYNLSLITEGSYSMGFHLCYNGFIVGLKTDTFLGGETLIQDIFLGWFGNKVGVELYYQNYKNYFIGDSKSSNKKYPSTPNEYPDLTIYNTGVSSYYFFKENSYRGLYTQSQEMLKNSWSPFLKPSAGTFIVKNKDSIIPATDRQYFDANIRNFNRYESYEMSLSAGITCTLAFHNIYFSPLVSIGILGEYVRYGNPGMGMKNGKNIYADFDIQAVLGYVGNEYFFGIWFINENQLSRVKDLSIQMMNFQTSIFVGTKL